MAIDSGAAFLARWDQDLGDMLGAEEVCGISSRQRHTRMVRVLLRMIEACRTPQNGQTVSLRFNHDRTSHCRFGRHTNRRPGAANLDTGIGILLSFRSVVAASKRVERPSSAVVLHAPGLPRGQTSASHFGA